MSYNPGANTGFWKGGGVQLNKSPRKKKGGGAALGPMLKSLHRGPIGGGRPYGPCPVGKMSGGTSGAIF